LAEVPVLVIGLGRFGTALAETLSDHGHEVLGVDLDPELVQRAVDRLTHVVQADATNLEAMRQLGASDFKHAVVAIGDQIEASILSTAVLVDLGVPDIWAKAITAAHGKILQRVGAHHVVLPEHHMGERVAHLVSGRMLDYIQLDEGFTLVETKPPTQLVGSTLGEAQVRTRFGITVVCIKPEGRAFTYATADTKVGPEDILVVAGETRHAEAFAELG
jgi:trk system potassium uptake protein TrkA